MADFYRETIAKGLQQYDNSQHSWQFYMDIAWEGLSSNLNDQNDPNGNFSYSTEAWNGLSIEEQNRIEKVIKNEKGNGNKNCN